MNAFFSIFSLISRDLEIFTVPRVVGRVGRSRLVFIPQAFRQGLSLFKILHVMTFLSKRKRFSTFNQEVDQLSFSIAFAIIEYARY